MNVLYIIFKCNKIITQEKYLQQTETIMTSSRNATAYSLQYKVEA